MTTKEPIASRPWHMLPKEEVLSALQTDAKKGLSSEEARERLAIYGPNELQAAERASAWALLFAQFQNVLIVILLIAIGLSAFLGHVVESITIGIIVLFAILLGFIQEYRAEKAIEALKKMASPTATVLREGKEWEIPASEVVPGDIVLLATGDKVPSDGRVIHSVNLQAEESPLTGESLSVAKQEDPVPGEEIPVGDRRSMVFAGTSITYGRGSFVATATGMRTEFGGIARLLNSVETTETPLQIHLNKMGKKLALAALVIVLVITTIGFFRGEPLLSLLLFGVALAVAVVPEALPAVVTISLALGVQRMVKRHALIRRLPAVETLGGVTVICTDKTGTLTKDEMTVRAIHVAGKTFEVSGSGYRPQGAFTLGGEDVTKSDALHDLLSAATLASDATILEEKGIWDIKGDPTEGALVVAAAKFGLEKPSLDEQFPRREEIPFTSETKRMTTLHETPEGMMGYSKGAPESLLPLATHILTEKGEEPLTGEKRKEVLEEAKRMASQALRVLAISRRKNATLKNVESEQTFLGLVGMIDPPRPEARSAIEKCHSAGIRVVMITGDHPITAQAIARELNLLQGGKTVTGNDLSAMSEEELEREVERIDVYARVSPAHKLSVVTALQKHGHVVAMTGDGVNDAPALKKADIGVAMGITGTDVTKEASAMLLTDDNFASIVAAVEEGRGIFGNVQKYILYLLSSNIGEIGIMFVTTLFGLPLPLSAVQILYVNLATDGLPALALAVDPFGEGLMRRPPRRLKEGLFGPPLIAIMLASGMWSTVINVGLFWWTLTHDGDLSVAMTRSFTLLVITEFFKAYAVRSLTGTSFHRPFANKWLNIAVLWEVVLLLILLYVPFFQRVFGTVPFSLQEWLLLIVLGATVIPVLEIVKWVIRRVRAS